MIRSKSAVCLLGLSFSILQSLNVYAETSQAKETSAAPTFKFNTTFYQPQLTDARLNDAVSAVDKMAQKLIDDGGVPGLGIAIVHNDKVILAKGYGVRVSGTPDKIDADTAFQLASVSKSLASTVVAGLVGDGKLSWDSKISDLDPDFEMKDPSVTREITVRDFFSHRSGMPDHGGDVLEDLGYDRRQVLHRLRYLDPSSSFRSAYAYTNFGLTEAAVAAAKTSGMDWETLCASRLYEPLGMTSTSSRFADFDNRANKALGHVLVDGKWVQKYIRKPDPQSPAGGASSSVNDMAKWMRLQLANGKFDSKQVIAEKPLVETHHLQMRTNYSPVNGLPNFYGLGMNVSYDQSGRLNLGHSGGFSRGVATCIKMIPEESLGICALTNAFPIGVAEALTSTFTDLALEGKSTQDWIPLYRHLFADPATLAILSNPKYKQAVVSPTLALKNEAYVGKYENDLFGNVEIVESNAGLAMKIGPKPLVFPLKHYDRDIFTYEPDAENLDGISGLRFDVALNGKAESVLIENLNDSGQGCFNRVKD